jgi:hypothetical protein
MRLQGGTTPQTQQTDHADIRTLNWRAICERVAAQKCSDTSMRIAYRHV